MHRRAVGRSAGHTLARSPPIAFRRGRPAIKLTPSGIDFAGQTIHSQGDGRLRVSLTINGAPQELDARAIIAEIGIGTCGARWTERTRGTARPISGDAGLSPGPVRWPSSWPWLRARRGGPRDDLTVMDFDHDPYVLDTAAKRRDAEWFVAQVERFIPPERKIHQRGVYYAIVSAGDVIKPDGDAFAGTDENAEFVKEACRLARWLISRLSASSTKKNRRRSCALPRPGSGHRPPSWPMTWTSKTSTRTK